MSADGWASPQGHVQQMPTIRGNTLETAPAPTFAQQISTSEALLARLTSVLGRVVNVAGGLHGHQPEPGREEKDPRVDNGLGMVQTLAAYSDRSHDMVSRIEQQLNRIEQALG